MGCSCRRTIWYSVSQSIDSKGVAEKTSEQHSLRHALRWLAMISLSLRLTIAYDGTRYLGWQQTREGLSIQGVLRQTAEQILQCPVCVEGASRTDAGVHALGQVALLQCQGSRYEEQRFLRSLIRLLPPDIAVLEAASASASFHPSLDARAKTYWYTVSLQPRPLERHRVWHLPGQGSEPAALDLVAIRGAAQQLLGTHDFSAFAVDHVDMPIRDPLCTLTSIAVEELEPGLIRLEFHGNRFLYKMVRSLAGTLIDCGRGRLHGEQIPLILASRRRERAGVCAPAHGLTLARVHYEAESCPLGLLAEASAGIGSLISASPSRFDALQSTGTSTAELVLEKCRNSLVF